MALTKCKECGHAISKSATQCPNCGAKIKRTSLFTKLIAGFFALVFLSAILGQYSSEERKAEKQKQAAAEQARVDSLPPEQKAALEKKLAEEAKAKREQELQSQGLIWDYNDSPDQMGRGSIKWATVRSLNEFEFDFPYKKPQRATLQLRKHPKHGKDVILSIERGQFLCRIDGCTIHVRFDQGKALAYNAVEPEDNSTTTIFIGNYDRFLEGLRKANKISIEAQFFHEGNRVFEFDVSGLKW